MQALFNLATACPAGCFPRGTFAVVTKGTQPRKMLGDEDPRWNPEKNDMLKADRGMSFERVVVAIEGGGLLDKLRGFREGRLTPPATLQSDRALRHGGRGGGRRGDR
jgi:hypothetical protein